MYHISIPKPGPTLPLTFFFYHISQPNDKPCKEASMHRKKGYLHAHFASAEGLEELSV